MSTIIKLRCLDQVLTFESTPVVASGGLEENFIQVEFCSKWDGLTKTAVFWRSEDDVYHVALDDSDSCAIPGEVLADEGVIYFGLFGVSGDGRQRTSEAMRYTIAKGAITSGTKPSDPTPDIYTDLLAKYQEMKELAAETLAAEQAFERAMQAAQEAFEQAMNQRQTQHETDVDADQEAFEQAMQAAQEAFEQEILDMIAAGLLPDNSVSTAKLQNGAVTAAKLAAGAVTSAKLAAGAVTKEKLAPGAVTAENIPVPEATATALGITDATVNGALWNLANFRTSLGNQYVWARGHKTVEYQLDTSSSSAIASDYVAYAATASLTLYNSISYVNGEWIISDVYREYSTTRDEVGNVLSADVLNVGVKYFKDVYGVVWATRPGASYGTLSTGGSNTWRIKMANVGKVVGQIWHFDTESYVNSSDPNAYPIADGYDYLFMGQFGEKIRIEAGTYTGTGVYGSANPNTLTFSFKPKIVWISRDRYLYTNTNNGYTSDQALFMWGTPRFSVYGTSGGYAIGGGNVVTYMGNTISWYNNTSSTSDANPAAQLNYGTYYYVAIG